MIAIFCTPECLATLIRAGLFPKQQAFYTLALHMWIIEGTFAYQTIARIFQAHFTLPTLTSNHPGASRSHYLLQSKSERRPTGASAKLTRLAKAGSHSAKSTGTDTGLKSLEPGV